METYQSGKFYSTIAPKFTDKGVCVIPEPTITPIYQDKRGKAWSIKFDGRELVLIYSKAGAYRGGHYHTKPEVSLLLTGKAEYTKKIGKEEYQFVQTPGHLLTNDALEPHLAHFLADSWLIDWKTAEGEYLTVNIPKYRKIVEKSLE